MPERNDTTPEAVLAAYDALVQAGGLPALDAEVRAARAAFQQRTGTYRADDPGTDVDARTRAFWDDALTTPGFAERAASLLGRDAVPTSVVAALPRAHRGLFVVDALEAGEAHLEDLWSGAELRVHILDETQAIALSHAEGAFDGRVVAVFGTLHLLPGAFHHPLDASPHIAAVLDKGRDEGLGTREVLDALLRMERVLRTSSRVKAAYAYRTSELAKGVPSTDERDGAR